MNKKYFLLFVGISISYLAFTQDTQQDFETTSISIFKNGTAFFIKSGQVEAENGNYYITENLPPALFGTYWLSSPSDALQALSSYVDTLETANKRPARSLPEMLSANLGKRVTLHVGQEEVIVGTVEAVEQVDPATRHIVTFRMDNTWRTFLMSEIRRIEFADKPEQSYLHKRQEVKPVLQVGFKTEQATQRLDMMYLANGLSWTPLYLIELTGEEQARLSLRAEVVNNVEDIEETDVNFVVGVPNFSFATRLSPLIDFDAAGFAGQVVGRGLNNFSNTLQAQTLNYAVAEDAVFDVGGTSAGLSGSAEEDLYFYTLPDMTLKKGGRGHYPVFTADIAIAHIYECNLPANATNSQYYRSEYLFSPSPHQVFHSIKVVNDTRYPFTTGAVLVMKKQGDAKPISQDRLNYTPVNGNSFVKLTEAPDVQIKQAEKAVQRQENSKQVSRNNTIYYYDLITVEGQIKVKNYKTKAIDLNIRRPIVGELQQSSVDWLKAERINTGDTLNPLTDVCWETNIGAGEELTITYTYRIYVPH